MRDRKVRQGHETYIREGYDYRTGLPEHHRHRRRAKAMIEEGIDTNTIAKVTGLSCEEVKSL